MSTPKPAERFPSPSAGEAYDRALALLHDCATSDGFVASRCDRDNYHRIWARDGVIIGLAALMAGDKELIRTFRQTLQTLAEHQGPHGEIPSNVDPGSQRISYGGTAGRVDADLWFVIGCGEYWRATDEDEFIESMLPVIEKVRFLLGAWEFNNRGFIYVPQTGDWADEYLQNGYVLYDQLLYLQAQRTIGALHAHVYGSPDHGMAERVSRLQHLIRDNFWFSDGGEIPPDAYHEILYEKGRDAASPHCAGRHWMPFFSPHGYGYRFDAFANVLASLFDVADDGQRGKVDSLIEDELVSEALPLLPAFHPVIRPVDSDWEELQMTFSHTFKNRPYEYHNGGLWPMITGFYVADLAARGILTHAGQHLQAIHAANALEVDGEPWSFPEFVHGKELDARGTLSQGWSAAAAVIGQSALDGRPLFRIGHHE